MPYTRSIIASNQATGYPHTVAIRISSGVAQSRLHRLLAISLLALLHLAPAAARAQHAPQTGVPAHLFAPVVNLHSQLGLTAQAEGRSAVPQTPDTLYTALPAADALITLDGKRAINEAVSRLTTGEPDLLAPINDALVSLKSLTGFDPHAVNRLVIGLRYAPPATGTSQTGFGMVMVAQSNEAGQLPLLIHQLGQGKYREEQYGGQTLYIELPVKTERKPAVTTSSPIAGNDEFAVATLDASTLVFGDAALVRASIDARAGKGARVNAELIAVATRNPKALISAAGLLPPSFLSDIVPAQQSGDGELQQALAALKQFYGAAELTPAGLDLTVAATAANPDQAKTLAHALDAVRTLAGLAPVKTSRDKLGRDIFKALTISTNGAEVQASVALTQANVNLLARQIAANIYVSNALAAKAKGDLSAAIAAYDRAIAMEPDNALIYINRGMARADRGEWDAAIADDDRALALAPDNALAYNNRGFIKLKKGDYAGAISDSDRAIALDPRLAYAYNNRGFALAQEGNLDAALADYDRSLALDANNALAYNNRGFARYQQGDLEHALADLDKAVQLDPNMVEARINRGFARMDNGDTAGARRDFDQALALNPKSADAYNGRGLAQYYKDDLAGALRDFDQAITLNPKLAEVYGNRALTRLKLGRDAEATQDFTTCFKLNGALRPRFEDLAREIKQTRRAKARPASARRHNKLTP
jgi:tetratricopeptide (TPR) repeat protein